MDYSAVQNQFSNNGGRRANAVMRDFSFGKVLALQGKARQLFVTWIYPSSIGPAPSTDMDRTRWHGTNYYSTLYSAKLSLKRLRESRLLAPFGRQCVSLATY